MSNLQDRDYLEKADMFSDFHEAGSDKEREQVLKSAREIVREGVYAKGGEIKRKGVYVESFGIKYYQLTKEEEKRLAKELDKADSYKKLSNFIKKNRDFLTKKDGCFANLMYQLNTTPIDVPEMQDELRRQIFWHGGRSLTEYYGLLRDGDCESDEDSIGENRPFYLRKLEDKYGRTIQKDSVPTIDKSTSYKELSKFIKKNKAVLSKDDGFEDLMDELGALKYMESDFESEEDDMDDFEVQDSKLEIEVAVTEIQDQLRQMLSKFAKGGKITDSEVWHHGEIVDDWASDVGGSNESRDNVIEYEGQRYLVITNSDQDMLLTPTKLAFHWGGMDDYYAKGGKTDDGLKWWTVKLKMPNGEIVYEDVIAEDKDAAEYYGELTDSAEEGGSVLNVKFKGTETYAKGGKVKKGNEMLIGGLVGILIGIFTGK